MREPAQPIRIEPRWPVVLAVAAVLFILAVSPARVRLFPFWFRYVIGLGLLLPVVGVWLSGADARWLRVERAATLVFSMLGEAMTLTALLYLIFMMLNRPAEFGGRQLLASSVGAWITNALAFSLVYWQIDRGGPEARANDVGTRPDWLFPQTGVPNEAPPDWRPTYVDYLFLAFSTAMAFSPSDALPLTSRAKMLMVLESTVSLLTLVTVVARAINILGS
ncbi:MAG: hypothetical protein A2Y76_09485 [Planctomycetes bacterium RBG_13_60_9]|nr:MAG: hypothetical protein A2Y76_09485 [Planctomycetes bacterium RBG_13_60_9]